MTRQCATADDVIITDDKQDALEIYNAQEQEMLKANAALDAVINQIRLYRQDFHG